jgi:hypothetical protein
MTTAEYLRRQAETCLRIARGCFDLTTVERLRHLAAELKTKAAEIEEDERLPPFRFEFNASSKRNNSRE